MIDVYGSFFKKTGRLTALLIAVAMTAGASLAYAAPGQPPREPKPGQQAPQRPGGKPQAQKPGQQRPGPQQNKPGAQKPGMNKPGKPAPQKPGDRPGMNAHVR